MTSITPFLWFDGQAVTAARFYVSLFPNSRILGEVGDDSDTMGVSFELDGQRFQALNGGPGHPFSDAMSLFVSVESQAEIDRLWDALTADGGAPGRCGWLTDRWGVSWQLVPPELGRLLGGADRERAARVMTAMLGMTKLDIAALEGA